MTFISYAQNHEDVMLWRALKHVGAGFYVDVGANHPSDDSVTRAFYDRGWSGINIEPLAEHIAQLRAERPRDINLQLAIGAQDGEIELFSTPVRGLATASSRVAERHQSAGLATVSQRVPMRRLDGVFAEHAPAEVHFLKIDVEGFERSVLEGMDFTRFRPWIAVVEATVPNSQEIDANWEPILLDAGYRCVYFDGLNRYYLARERESLAPSFAAPPNVFDDFISAERHRLEQCLEAAISRAEQAETRLWQHDDQARRKIDELERNHEAAATQAAQRIRELESAIAAMHASTSWRVTKPLRQVVSRLRDTPRQPASAAPAAPSGAADKEPPEPPDPAPTSPTPGDAPIEANGATRATAAPPGEEDGASQRFNLAVFPTRVRPPEAMFLAPPKDDGDYCFRFLGHVEGHYSLAIVNRALALALDTASHGQLTFIPYHYTPYENPAGIPAEQHERIQTLCARHLPADARSRTISLAHHYPLIADPDPARHRLALFFWEETAVPEATVAQLSADFDAVLVASSFVKRALRNSGCRLPIFVIPIGIDHLITAQQTPVASLRPAGDARFRFLHVSSAFERKGIDVLLRAYFAQFRATDQVELLIKTFPNPHNRVHEQLAELSAGRGDAPRVIVDEAPLDDAAMLDLYRSAQALILPTRGEGFNLPAAEAMALGIPVVVTAFGAHLDFCTRATALPVPFRFSPSRSHLHATQACWVDPEVEALADQLRIVRTQAMCDDRALEDRRQAGIRHVRQTYTWQRSATAVYACAHWLDTHPRGVAHTARTAQTTYRMALLSPWATRCGIAEYSQELIGPSEFARGDALRVYCDTRTSPDPGQSIYRPCWAIGDVASIRAALEQIAGETPDVVLVQHQPALFSLHDDICATLARLRRQGCLVIVELHSTLQLVHEYREGILSSRAIAVLRTLDRLIVHKPEDFNHLLKLGIADNVVLLPLGVVQPPPAVRPGARRSAWGIADDALVLGSFGFLLPHKGVDSLIESIAPLALATGRPVHLLAQNAAPDAGSQTYLQTCRQRASALGVESQITWITDYRPIDECVELLTMADYVIFPYHGTRESASGAVTIGLAAQRPVLVSPLPIFSDLAGCTWRMHGDGAEAIVEAVCTLEQDRAQVEAMRERQHAWLAERDWKRIAARLDAVIDGLLLDRALDDAVALPRDHYLAGAPLPSKAPAQLLVDVSELYFRDARTGIQRVVRSILAELTAAPPAGYRVCPVFATADHDYRYADIGSGGSGRERSEANERPVRVNAGDIFLGLDLSAHLFPRIETQLREFRLAGVRLHFVVYDIIPLLRPQFCDAPLCAAFHTWMHALARLADSLLCISSAVVDEVRHWLSQNTDDSPLLKVRPFHLGADIANSHPTTGLPEQAAAIIERIGRAPTFLMVGTIEPRKGQLQTLGAFEQLWRDGDDVNLVLVGKLGWKMGDFPERVRQHHEFGQRLIWLEGISDEFLEQVYAAATCLIAASEAEGFGLPLIEAAQHGLPIIARDIPVFREVAGKHASYFSHHRPEVLASEVRSWLLRHRARLTPDSSTMPWLTWRESAQQLTRLILED